MARYNRLSPMNCLASIAAYGYCMLLLRQTGGGVIAQTDGGGGGNTTSSSNSEYPSCLGYTQHIQDGYCDADLNNAGCGYDGGDCCACTCGASGEELAHSCREQGGGFDCQDPDVPADCGVTPSPAAAFGYPDCPGFMGYWQDSYCDDDLNNAACGYDGGDCCRCTCREDTSDFFSDDFFSDDYFSNPDMCGVSGYDCQDPDAPSECGTESPTPSPSAGDGSTLTDDDTSYFGSCPYVSDGECDSFLNTEACDWDGGDCCQCDCLEIPSPDFPCGISGYNCLDPDSSCTSSSSGSGFYHDDASNIYNSPGYYRASSSADENDDSSEAVFSSAQLASVFGLSVGVFCVLGCILLAAFVAFRRRRRSGENEAAADADQSRCEVQEQPSHVQVEEAGGPVGATVDGVVPTPTPVPANTSDASPAVTAQ